jgi:prepilin-type N-terminal cleavage/methylation domain-containing protein
MKSIRTSRHRGFTLLETVIAIGVLAVLLSGFMVVFTPAAEGIRKSINVQQADRLASTLEQELVTLRGNESGTFKTGFNKSYEWIKDSDKSASAIMIYQYRGEMGGTPRPDGTPSPVVSLTGKVPGKDYMVIPMVRLKSDSLFNEDLRAVEGAVYLVKCTQLIFDAGELKLGTPGTIKDPKGTTPSSSGDDYPEAVIAFSADFHMMPAKTADYFSSAGFNTRFTTLKNPVFSRNLAVRR